MSQPQTTAESSRPPLPRLWARFSVPAGSAIQLSGIAAGGALLIAAAHAGIPGGRALLVGTILWTIASTITVAIVPKGDYAKALRALGWRKPLSSSQPGPEQTQRARTWGPDRRGPRGRELRNAVVGWSLVNALLVALWAHAGGGFPWFLFVTVPSALGVGSWALQGRREAAAHQD